MTTIALESLTIEGFRAFKAPTTFQLTQGAGLKLITGANKTNKRLGANGVGKSSLWDALLWCLFGASVRMLRSSDLVSWGGEAISVGCVFTTSEGTRLTIERTSKPPRIKVDGVLADQATVDRTLGLSRARFLHSVLFGQAARLLPDLSLPERAHLFDDIMDLAVWNRASERSVAKYAALREAITEAANKISQIDAKLEATGEGVLAGLEEAAEDWEARCQRELDGARAALRRAKGRQKEAQEQLEALPVPEKARKLLVKITRAIAALVDERDVFLRRRSEAGARIKSAEKEIAFYGSKEVCSVCEQPISTEFAEQRSAMADAIGKQAHREQAKLNKELLDLENELKAWRSDRDQVLGKIAKYDERSRSAASVLREADDDVRLATGILDELEQAAASENPHAVRLRELKRSRKALVHEREHMVESSKKLERQSAALDYWRTGFKKVRFFELRRTLNMLEIDVGNAINSLGLSGWSVKFTTETENKSGGTRSGIQLVVSSPAATAVWEAWSGGEGQRLRVAIAVGFANLIQRVAGTEFNFEVWDEPSSWLSPEGVEDLLSTLAHRAQQTGKSIWLLDHRALQFTSFAEIWEVKKNRKGATIRRLQ